MSTWEERMAAQSRAKGRHYPQEMERKRQAEESEESEYDRIHGTHHTHLKGSAVYCSCGEFGGVICVAFPPEWATITEDQVRAEVDALRCGTCGAEGVVDLKR